MAPSGALPACRQPRLGRAGAWPSAGRARTARRGHSPERGVLASEEALQGKGPAPVRFDLLCRLDVHLVGEGHARAHARARCQLRVELGAVKLPVDLLGQKHVGVELGVVLAASTPLEHRPVEDRVDELLVLPIVLDQNHLLVGLRVHDPPEELPDRGDFHGRVQQVRLPEPLRVVVLQDGDRLSHGLQRRPVVPRVPREVHQDHDLPISVMHPRVRHVVVEALHRRHGLSLVEAGDGALQAVHHVPHGVLVDARVSPAELGVDDGAPVAVETPNVHLPRGILSGYGLGVHAGPLRSKAEFLAPPGRCPDPGLRLLGVPALATEVAHQRARVAEEALVLLLRVLGRGERQGQLPEHGPLLALQRQHAPVA
mmetsp:Transcript_90006/g.291290  ORF Transcript_90006/g.291290 Transcript_90006/m.291290 type:complete len:370 (+) Transcript_90006:15-1124(+)